MIASLLANWRCGALGLVVAGALIAGWQVNSWRVQAAEARGLRTALRHEIERRVAADVARLATEKSLVAAEGQTHEVVKEVVKQVVVRVPDRRECDLNNDVVRLLERARGNVPDAPGALVDSATKPAATPNE